MLRSGNIASTLRACEATRHGTEAEEGEEDVGPLLRGVHFLALEARGEGALWDLRPSFVVLFDPDIGVIRELEVCL